MLQEQHPSTITGPASEDEITYAVEQLDSSQKALHDAVQGLSAAQSIAKPAPDRWSVAECVEHIVLVEGGIFGRLQTGMQQDEAPEKRAEIQVSDLYLTKALRSRKTAITAPAPFEPTGRFGSLEAALAAFDEQRAAIIDYVHSAPGNWRTHYFKHLVFGTIDAYQTLLLFAGHCERHRKQIEEVKASPGFPA
ncbi:DinB family protein [Fibrella sp. HMF5335]|uniref:DinB family protein n=1 Tax=Fibrella rubiginis TaxID=2817060 RepID=A0A939K616_9BACT|nr:DinB family protein [Fibrella rubiginis]MBO0938363.1 DinB family protein [Fibrella rubiginis]